MHTLDGEFRATIQQIPSEWLHVVLNYIGPDDGQGIWIYMDGVQTGSDVTKTPSARSPGGARVVLGKLSTDGVDDLYATVTVDELLFFNEKLGDQDIIDIKNMA